jgi:hypothetical protein
LCPLILPGQGGDTEKLFDDLDYFLLPRGYPQRHMPLLDFKDGRFGAGGMSFWGDWREPVWARPRVAVPDEGKFCNSGFNCCNCRFRSTLWVLDTLSVPAMSVECESVSSSVKKLSSPERNALADSTIEACECLKAWWNQDLIRGLHDVLGRSDAESFNSLTAVRWPIVSTAAQLYIANGKVASFCPLPN